MGNVENLVFWCGKIVLVLFGVVVVLLWCRRILCVIIVVIVIGIVVSIVVVVRYWVRWDNSRNCVFIDYLVDCVF